MTPADLAEKLGATVTASGTVVIGNSTVGELNESVALAYGGRLEVQGQLTLRNGIYAFPSVSVTGTLVMENATLQVMDLSYSGTSKIRATDSQIEPFIHLGIRGSVGIRTAADSRDGEGPLPLEFRNVQVRGGIIVTLSMTRESSNVHVESSYLELGVPHGTVSESNNWSVDADEVRIGIARSWVHDQTGTTPIFSRFPRMSIRADTVTVGAFPEDYTVLWFHGMDAFTIQGKTRAPSKLVDGWLLDDAPGWLPDSTGYGGNGKVVLSDSIQCERAAEPSVSGGSSLSGVGHPLNVTLDRAPPMDVVEVKLALSTESGQIRLIEGRIIGNQFSVLSLPMPVSVCTIAGAPPEPVTEWQLGLETGTQFGCARGKAQDTTATVTMLPRLVDGTREACLTELPSATPISG